MKKISDTVFQTHEIFSVPSIILYYFRSLTHVFKHVKCNFILMFYVSQYVLSEPRYFQGSLCQIVF